MYLEQSTKLLRILSEIQSAIKLKPSSRKCEKAKNIKKLEELKKMDNELVEMIVRLKCESRILRGLVDTILDNTRLSYSEDSIRIAEDEPVIMVLKAFFGDEVKNRLEELKAEREKEESENG